MKSKQEIVNKVDERHRFVQMFQTFHKHVERRHGDKKSRCNRIYNLQPQVLYKHTIKRCVFNVLLPLGNRAQQYQNAGAERIGSKLPNQSASRLPLSSLAMRCNSATHSELSEDGHVSVLKVHVASVVGLTNPAAATFRRSGFRGAWFCKTKD